MKILIIPDVHGRTCWKKACESPEDYSQIVFLGDYLDPYTFDYENNKKNMAENCLTNFKEIIDFSLKNPNVRLLLGNHDLPYFNEDYIKYFGNYWCRHDYENHSEINKLFVDNINKFQYAWDIKYNGFRYLFSHAGVTGEFLQRMIIKDYKMRELKALNINKFFDDPNNAKYLAMCSTYRGGSDYSGSLVWADLREYAYAGYPFQTVYQIFGHTYVKAPWIEDKYAMLDDGEHLFVLNLDEKEEEPSLKNCIKKLI